MRDLSAGPEDVDVELRDDGLHIELVVPWPHDPGGEEDVGGVFVEEARRLLDGELPGADVTRRAARLAVAEQAWSKRLGTLFDARDVVDLLKVTKQRVSALTQQGRLVALPVEGRLRYPAWQFAGLPAHRRAALATAHRQLVEAGGIDPWSAADWATRAHPDLGGADPVGWLRADGAVEDLLRAAQRDAGRAAQ